MNGVNPVHATMQIEYKCTVPGDAVNVHNTAKGSYLFELMDLAGATRASPLFVGKTNGVIVTSDADIKYILPVNAFDYVEVHVGIINITASKVVTNVELYIRATNSLEWRLASTGHFSFSLVDRSTRKLVRIPKEVINEIKG